MYPAFASRGESSIAGPSIAVMRSINTRARNWPDGKSVASLAVGYRFDTSRLLPENPELDTQFTDSSGEECGRHRVKFLNAQDHFGYRVDSDLESLLAAIASCVAHRPLQ